MIGNDSKFESEQDRSQSQQSCGGLGLYPETGRSSRNFDLP